MYFLEFFGSQGIAKDSQTKQNNDIFNFQQNRDAESIPSF
jgi:hypothetical protein